MKKVTVIILSVLLCFGLFGCGEKDTSPVGASEINELYTSPDNFKDRTFEFDGRVLKVEKNGDELAIQVYYDIKNYDKNTIVYYSDSSFSVKADDFIHVKGTISGEFSGENALGGEVTAPSVTAETVTLIDYQTAMAPTKKEIVPEKNTITQKGYSVTINKIELADSETRVYLTVKNDGKGVFSLYTFDAKLMQDGKQYDTQDNFEAEYPEISSDLKQNATTDGIVCFPAIKENDFSISFKAYSDDFDENIKDFDFKIAVN